VNSKSASNHEEERLQKLLARAGVASRRMSENLIRAGRVTVNGVVAELGQSAHPSDLVKVDGQPVLLAHIHTTMMLNKPRGFITTASDELGRRTVLELVPAFPGLHPVGRLDRDSEGLLILTTDGELTLSLTHPRFVHEKEYRVWCDTEPSDEQLEQIWNGVELEDGPARPKGLRAAPDGARIVLTEGRKRQVRRMFEAVELRVTGLLRTRVGALDLGDLRTGEWRKLGATDLKMLRKSN
jgi:23S rRNA pseudouridine2605 synthase